LRVHARRYAPRAHFVASGRTLHVTGTQPLSHLRLRTCARRDREILRKRGAAVDPRYAAHKALGDTWRWTGAGSEGGEMDIGQVQIHRSLTRPVLLGGAERAPAIINATTMLGIGLGPGFHWPNVLLAIFLGTTVHMLLRRMAKRDPQFFAVYLRHLRPAGLSAFCRPGRAAGAGLSLVGTIQEVLSHGVVGARWGESGEAVGAAGVCGALAVPALSAARTGGASHSDQVGSSSACRTGNSASPTGSSQPSTRSTLLGALRSRSGEIGS
jgi:type IV secretory pathway TrbD component